MEVRDGRTKEFIEDSEKEVCNTSYVLYEYVYVDSHLIHEANVLMSLNHQPLDILSFKLLSVRLAYSPSLVVVMAYADQSPF